MNKNKKNNTFSETIIPTSQAEKAYWDALAQRSDELMKNKILRDSLKRLTIEDVLSW